MTQEQFKCPKNQTLRVRYIKSNPDQTKEILAVVTENTLTHKFFLYLPDDNGEFYKKGSGDDPEFKELETIYEVPKKKTARKNTNAGKLPK